MRTTRRLIAAAAVGVAVGSMLSLPAAGQSPDTAIGALPHVESQDPDKRQWNELRDAGERACKQAVDSAAMLGEHLYDLKLQLSRALVQVSGDLTRGMAQGMNELAERLHDMAERMERPAD